MRILLPLFISALVIQMSVAQSSFNTQLLGKWDPPTSYMPVFSGVQFNDVWGYVTPEGQEIAILGNPKYAVFLNVTNPAAPNEIFKHEAGDLVIWRDFKTYKQYAYGVCDSCNEGLWVYDMSGIDCLDGIVPVTNNTSDFDDAHNIFIDEENHRLYVAGFMFDSNDLRVYDLAADPANPQLIATINFNTVVGTGTDFYVHDIYVRDNIAYCSHGFSGYYIWDLNDLSNTGAISNGGTIELLADGNYNGYNHSSWLTEDGNYAIVAEEVPGGEPMISVDLQDLFSGNTIAEEIQFRHRIDITASGYPTPHNPFIRDDYLYIAYYKDGLKVYDVSDPTDPDFHGFYDTYTGSNNSYGATEGAWGCYPFFPSGNVLISDITYGLHIISVSDVETCKDGIQNQDETGIDCGGKYCLPCDSCTDGIQNQDETGIDCGGSICCAPCMTTTCDDGIQNQDETGVDCGGPICTPCDCDAVSLTLTSDLTSTSLERYQSFVSTSGNISLYSPAQVSYYAGDFLELNPQFEVKLGAELLLDIDACQ